MLVCDAVRFAEHGFLFLLKRQQFWVRRRRQASGRALVEIAHMELAAPSIADAVAKCAAAGATSVIVAPYFLSRWGFHPPMTVNDKLCYRAHILRGRDSGMTI